MSLRHRFIQGIHSKSNCFARVVACAVLAGAVTAQDAENPETPTEAPGNRPASAGRVVRAFDFEEYDFNPLPVPLGWIRAQEDPQVPRVRPGFPIWNGAVLDYKSPAYSGKGTVHLPTSGGSTSLFLRHGEINIFPNADYLITARVRTQDIKYAKAAIVARLLNQQGEPIEGAESTTPMVNTQGEWEQISLEIEGIFTDAAFIQIELLLLQPEQQFGMELAGAYEVWDQDFHGGAWFDNLVIAQLPRLELTTGQPGNLVESETPPAIQVLVRDLTGDAIVARARIYDVHGNEIDSEILADGSRRVRTHWTPKLPGYGWYRAVLEVSVDSQLVGIRALDFIWSPPGDSNTDSGMFGVHAKLTNPKIAQSAHALIQGAGVTRASVEVWNHETTREDIEPDQPTMQAIDQLIAQGIKLSIVLSQLPKELADAQAVDPDEVISIFAGDSSAWLGWGAAMLDQYGQAVSHWRLSNLPTQEDSTTLNTQLEAIRSAFFGYVPGPVLVTPWAIDRPIEQAVTLPNREMLIVDNATTDERAMELIVEDWLKAIENTDSNTPENHTALAMVLGPALDMKGASSVEAWSSIGRLARKAISFWWAASSTGLGNESFNLELKDAWRISPGKRGQVMPAPEIVVWRTLATHLGGRTAIEELDLMPGVRMLLAGPKPSGYGDNEHDESGILVLWLDDPSIDNRVLSIPLSMSRVTQIDVFNNQTNLPLEYIGDLNLPVHRITIGRSPIIVTEVNTDLVRFLSAIELTPNTLQSRSGIHKHALVLTNPWGATIRGRVYIVEPGGYTSESNAIDRSWEITPRVVPFVLDAYESREMPIDIAFSLGEIAGDKKLTFDVELQADADYPLMRIERSIELKLDGVEMQLTARRGHDGITVVAVAVTNKFDTTQNFELIAIPPNESRLRRAINSIKPGQRVVREFAFRKTNPGDQVIVTLLVPKSSTRINKVVRVP